MLEDFKLEKKNNKRQASPARNREDSRGLEIWPTPKKFRKELSKHFLGGSSPTETGQGGTSTLHESAEHSNNFATDKPIGTVPED